VCDAIKQCDFFPCEDHQYCLVLLRDQLTEFSSEIFFRKIQKCYQYSSVCDSSLFQSVCSAATRFLGFCRRRSSRRRAMSSSHSPSRSSAFNASSTRFLRKVGFIELRLIRASLSVCLLFRAVILLTQPNDHQPNETSQKFYFTSAVFYVSALVASNSALRFISYPSQVIAKGEENLKKFM
jgi:hypothetical protein